MNNYLYKNTYRVQSTRLPDWDYSWPGVYFVTICTKNRETFFGDVAGDNKMILNNLGRIVVDEWIKTPQIRKNVKLGEFIIMPNHIHGIIIIDNGDGRDLFEGINAFLAGNYFYHDGPPIETPHQNDPRVDNLLHNQHLSRIMGDSQRVVSTQKTCMVRRDDPLGRLGSAYKPYTGDYPEMSEISPKSNSLGAIINQIKSICKKRIKHINPYFGWQARFYDRIIRNEQGLHNARHYIISNPEKWYRDRNNPAGLGM